MERQERLRAETTEAAEERLRAEALADRRRTLSELQTQHYMAWRHHPVSRVLMAYLMDYRLALQQVLLQRWETGSTSLAQDEQEIRGRVAAIREFVDLDWEAVRQFYGLDDDSNTEASIKET